jgi:hypothetical protein
MTGGMVVAIIWVIVFIIGVAVGVITIVALSALRKDKKDPPGPRPGPDDPDDEWLERDHGVSGIAGHWDIGPRWPDEPVTPEDRRTS